MPANYFDRKQNTNWLMKLAALLKLKICKKRHVSPVIITGIDIYAFHLCSITDIPICIPVCCITVHVHWLTVVIGEEFADIGGNCFFPKHTWNLVLISLG